MKNITVLPGSRNSMVILAKIHVFMLGVVLLLSPLGCQPESAPIAVPVTDKKVPQTEETVATDKRHEPVGSFSLTMVPSQITTSTTQVKLDVQGCRPENLAAIEWLLNGQVVGENPSLPLAELRPAPETELTVRARCGEQNAFDQLIINNSPPLIEKVELGASLVAAGVGLELIPTTRDNEGDPVDYQVLWRIDSQPLSEPRGLILPGELIKTGALIEALVTPIDPFGAGQIYGVRPFRVPDQPPWFVSSPPEQFTRPEYTYQVVAQDAENQPLEYSLVEGPEGMAISPTSGLLTWPIPPNANGEFPVIIAVADIQGQKTHQKFTLVLPANTAP